MHRDPERDAAPGTQEQGQTMAEYAVVLGVITMAVVLSFILLGDTAGGAIQAVADWLTSRG